MPFRLLFNAGTLRISKLFLLLWTISWPMQSLYGQTNSWYDPVTHTSTNLGPTTYNTPASSWSPGSTMQPQTQNPYAVNMARTASSYSPPNPYVRPTPQQTQWYVDNHPALWNLPSSMKSQIVNGTNPWFLNGSYLPNGFPNPFYHNGQIIPNWYVPATWPTPGANWVGVQPNGFLPAANSATYGSSFNNYHSSYSPMVTSVPHVTNFTPSSSSYTQPSQVQPSSSRVQQDPDRAFFTANSVRESPGLSPLRPGIGEITRAIENSQRSLALSEAAGDKVGQVTSHATLAELFIQQGKIDRARTQIGMAENIAGEVGDSGSQIALLRSKAALLMASGEFEEAISDYQQITSALGEFGDESAQAGAQISLGWAYQSKGDVPRALAAYEKARGLYAKAGNRDGEIRVALGMGSLYQSIGEFEKASEQYMPVAKDASQEQFAQMLVSVAEIYAARQRPVNALTRYEKALTLIGVNHDSPLGVSILTGIGRCHMALGHYAEARRYFDEADTNAIIIGDRRLEAGVLASIGELYYWLAITPTYASSRIISSNPTADFQRSLVNSGRLSPAAVDSSVRSVFVISNPNPKKNFSNALEAYNKSLVLTRAAGDRIGEIGVLTNTGLAYDAWGKHDHALEYYLAALEKLDDLQTGARLEEFRINLAGQSAELYRRAIELEVNQHHPEEAFNLTERSRARSFLDQLGNSRIDLYKDAPKDFVQQEDVLRRRNIALQRQLAQEMGKPGPEVNSEKIQSLQAQLSRVQHEYQEVVVSLKLSTPAYSSFLNISPLRLNEVQQNLPPDTTVISYFITPERTLAFVITSKSFHVSELPVKGDQLRETILNFLDFSGTNNQSAALKSLYSWLIEPLKSHLKTARLVLVPHGPLNDLPFAALSPDGNQYLNDGYTISYLPSVSALPYFKSKGKPGDHIVILANDQEEGAPQLSHAYDEARAVASFGTAQLLLGNDATASAVQTIAGNYDIVHLIGHVYVDRDYPQFSRISLGQSLERDGPLDLNRILRLNLRQTSLVVLSGCQTQTGNRSRGDDVIALNRAFLYAGAASVIASLWSVDDDATRELMIAFYRHLREEPDRARALREAQMEIRQKYPNPYYWAGFVLTGNPGGPENSNFVASSAK